MAGGDGVGGGEVVSVCRLKVVLTVSGQSLKVSGLTGARVESQKLTTQDRMEG